MAAEWRRIVRLWPILLVTYLYYSAIIGTRPLISLYADSLHATAAFVGLLSSLFGMGALLMTIPVGRLLDTKGGFYATRIGCVLLAATFLMVVVSRAPGALLVVQAIAGVGFILAVLGGQAAVADAGGHADHASNYSHYASVISIAHLTGPVMYGWIADRSGYPAAFGVAAGICLLAACAAFVEVPSAAGKSAGLPMQGSTWRNAAALLKKPIVLGAIVTGALVLFAQDALLTFFPLYAKSLSLTATMTGVILSSRAVTLLMIRPFLGWAVSRFGRRLVLSASLVAGGLSTATMGLFSTVHGLMLASAVAGITIGLAQPLTMAMVAEYAPPEVRGLALSLRMGGNRLGQAVSPLLMGLVAGPLGSAVALWASGAVLATGALFVMGPLGRAMSMPTDAMAAPTEPMTEQQKGIGKHV